MQETNPFTWPRLYVNGDRGADGICGVHTLKHNDIIVHFNSDEGHDFNNDFDLGLTDADLNEWSSKMTAALSYAHGHWIEKFRWQQVREALDEARLLMTDTKKDAALMDGLDRMLCDKGLQAYRGENKVFQTMRQEALGGGVWDCIGERPKHAKYLNLAHHIKERAQHWRTLRYGFLTATMMLDGLEKSSMGEFAQAIKDVKIKKEKGVEAPDGTCKASAATPATFSDFSGIGTLTYGAMVFADSDNQRYARILFVPM